MVYADVLPTLKNVKLGRWREPVEGLWSDEDPVGSKRRSAFNRLETGMRRSRFGLTNDYNGEQPEGLATPINDCWGSVVLQLYAYLHPASGRRILLSKQMLMPAR